MHYTNIVILKDNGQLSLYSNKHLCGKQGLLQSYALDTSE